MRLMHVQPANNGFTLIELITVVSIVSILAAVAMPAYSDYLVRASVSESLRLVQPMQQKVAEYYAWHGELPENNHTLGLPPATQLQGTYVASIAIVQGVIVVQYGNRSAEQLTGKNLRFTPKPPAAVFLNLTWQCLGVGIDRAYLPTACKR